MRLVFVFLMFSSILVTDSLATSATRGRVRPSEFCDLAVRVLWGGPNPKASPAPYIPVDLLAFIGKPYPYGTNWLVNRIAPLWPPALHANVLYRRLLLAAELPENYGKSLFQIAHEIMGHRIDVSEDQLERIPKAGSFLMISNHPTGVLDGTIDAHLLDRRGRDDFSIIVAHFLETSMEAHPDLGKHFLYVDRRHRKFEDTPRDKWTDAQKKIGEQADETNRKAFRAMLKSRNEGRVVVLYPTGSIASQLPNPKHPVTYDAQWDSTTLSMVKAMKVVVPTFKVVRNSDEYLELKKKSVEKSRAAYFAEALNKYDKVVKVIVGEPFTWDDVVTAVPGPSNNEIDQARLLYIRSRVDSLDPYGIASLYARPSQWP